MKKVKVILADDSPEYLRGLKALLSLSEKYEVIATYADGEALVNSNKLGEADLVLSDIQMPKLTGIIAGARINFDYPNLCMIALTMHKDAVFLTEIIGAGFKGFVHKPDTATDLLGVIEKVLNNEFVFPDNLEI